MIINLLYKFMHLFYKHTNTHTNMKHILFTLLILFLVYGGSASNYHEKNKAHETKRHK